MEIKKLEDYLEKQDFFDIPEKKAVFLEGVLTRFLLDIQYARRESTPFEARLHGLKLDGRRIKKLLPEIVEKLREYRSGYPRLEELISKNLIGAGRDWELSEDETSYCFTLGLNLGRIFKKERGGE